MRKLVVSLAVVALVAGLAATAAAVSGAGTKTVSVADDVFTPHKFSIKKGSIVRWVWSKDNVDEHTVTQADKHFDPKDRGFSSKEQATGPSFAHRFKKAGTYYIVCLVHPTDMRIKISVH
ncbi:MAG: plastocyanin/azurin family copper-binding protein [Thermoleophilaceae bacterium]